MKMLRKRGMKLNKKYLVWLSLIIVITLIILIVFLNMNNTLIKDNKITGEIISKRTYNSQTYSNNDGTYTSVIAGGAIFFYDGQEYVEIDKISSPLIEKKIITLNEIPKSNLIDFGAYQLHKGVDVSISSDGELLISDANKKIIQVLPRPFSFDVNNDTIMNDYKIEMIDGINKKFSLKVEVDKNWLQNADYPVEVDPTITLDSTSGIYGGYIDQQVTSYYRYPGSDFILLGRDLYGYKRGFIEFDTSSIPDSAVINNVILTFTVSQSFPTDVALDMINITRFNNTKINNLTKYTDDDTGNNLLGSNIATGTGRPAYVAKSIELETTGDKIFDLGTNADNDLQNQLTGNYFGVGIRHWYDNPQAPLYHDAEIILSPTQGPSPKLIVTYTAPIQYSCQIQIDNNPSTIEIGQTLLGTVKCYGDGNQIDCWNNNDHTPSTSINLDLKKFKQISSGGFNIQTFEITGQNPAGQGTITDVIAISGTESTSCSKTIQVVNAPVNPCSTPGATCKVSCDANEHQDTIDPTCNSVANGICCIANPMENLCTTTGATCRASCLTGEQQDTGDGTCNVGGGVMCCIANPATSCKISPDADIVLSPVLIGTFGAISVNCYDVSNANANCTATLPSMSLSPSNILNILSTIPSVATFGGNKYEVFLVSFEKNQAIIGGTMTGSINTLQNPTCTPIIQVTTPPVDGCATGATCRVTSCNAGEQQDTGDGTCNVNGGTICCIANPVENLCSTPEANCRASCLAGEQQDTGDGTCNVNGGIICCVCQSQPEVCNDSIDNDCDLLIDCADSSCTGNPACVACNPLCISPVCNPVPNEICENLVDDNCNGQINEGCIIELPRQFCGELTQNQCAESIYWTPTIIRNIQSLSPIYDSLNREINCGQIVWITSPTNPNAPNDGCGIRFDCGCQLNTIGDRCLNRRGVSIMPEGASWDCIPIDNPIRNLLGQCLTDVNNSLLGECIFANNPYKVSWTADWFNSDYSGGFLTIASPPPENVVCENGDKTFPCPSKSAVPFFTFFNLIISCLVIAGVYFVFRRK